MANLKVQEYIARSGRYHVFQKAHTDIRSALVALRSKAAIAQMSYRTYYVYDDLDKEGAYQENAHKETDYDTYVDVISNGGAKRRFTIVTKRGGEPVPFGHLVKQPEKGQ